MLPAILAEAKKMMEEYPEAEDRIQEAINLIENGIDKLIQVFEELNPDIAFDIRDLMR